MSVIPKLQTLLALVFILATGSISITAQTPVSAGSSSSRTLADAVSTNEPNGETNNESRKTSITPAEKASPDKSAVVREVDSANSVEVSVSPTITPRAATETAETIVPRSPQATDPDKWQFQFSPYFWLASLHGTAGVGNRTTQVDESFGDIFDSLKFALMGVVEARKGKFVLVVDTEYVSIEDDRATPGPFFSDVTASSRPSFLIRRWATAFTMTRTKGSSVDILGGIRVWHVSTELDFGAGILPATQIQGSRNWVDAIVGLRGKAAVSEKLFVTGKFDLGGGGSKFTWQLFGGGGYNINAEHCSDSRLPRAGCELRQE